MDLGQVDTRACPSCEKERPFNLLLQYKYRHVYYFRWVSKRVYHVACSVCNRGAQVDTKETQAKLEKDPIPFMTRRGWMFLAAPFAAVFLYAFLQPLLG
ncbi:hypothetical protein OIK44_18380 [Janthinobacterium sp. hw3]|uniref:Zinc-ribbon 15 domain-containing protein n=1 Tax=Janthinobacterium fluminis TaxID=2987524 RepID=A0ABT5K3U4_9BURK|nr:hypothetical protein [Janthinobacterium fluminis]